MSVPTEQDLRGGADPDRDRASDRGGACGSREGRGMSARRKVLAVALTTITIMCLLWCILRLQADGFAILAAVTFVALAVTIGAHRRSFWA